MSHTRSLSRCQGLDEYLFFFVYSFVLAGNVAKLPTPPTKPNTRRRNKHRPLTGRQELTEHACKNSRPISQKRRKRPTLTKFGGLTLDQPVEQMFPAQKKNENHPRSVLGEDVNDTCAIVQGRPVRNNAVLFTFVRTKSKKRHYLAISEYFSVYDPFLTMRFA